MPAEVARAAEEAARALAPGECADGEYHVEYTDYVDEDGVPLCDVVGRARLRLPPPAVVTGWAPRVGE